jgi:flagellar assembly factor FliW
LEPKSRGQKWSFVMQIETVRFGKMSIDEERILTFPNGLLGFPEHQRFALIQSSAGNYFFWLQSLDDPALAFVVTDPTTFFKDFTVPVKDELRDAIALADPAHMHVFVICNRVGEWLTGNLLGPLVYNTANRVGEQIVLQERKWTTRQPLLRLQVEMPLAKSA